MKPPSFPYFCFVKLRFPTPRRRGPLWSETFISEASYLSLLQYLTTLWLHFDSLSHLFAIPYNTFATFRCQKWTPYSTLATFTGGPALVSSLLFCKVKISYSTEARTPLVGNLYFWKLLSTTFVTPSSTLATFGSPECALGNTLQHFGTIFVPKVHTLHHFGSIFFSPPPPKQYLTALWHHFHSKSAHLTSLWERFL